MATAHQLLKNDGRHQQGCHRLNNSTMWFNHRFCRLNLKTSASQCFIWIWASSRGCLKLCWPISETELRAGQSSPWSTGWGDGQPTVYWGINSKSRTGWKVTGLKSSRTWCSSHPRPGGLDFWFLIFYVLETFPYLLELWLFIYLLIHLSILVIETLLG